MNTCILHEYVALREYRLNTMYSPNTGEGGHVAPGPRLVLLVEDEKINAAASKKTAVTGAVGMTTRSQQTTSTLDDAVAELFYGENLPEELADSARWNKLLNLCCVCVVRLRLSRMRDE